MKRIAFLAFLISAQSFAAFDWQGHRGARGLYPENSIGAMKEGLKYPITTLEMDVVISSDGEVVVSHEPWMSAEICLTPKGETVQDRVHNLYKLTAKEIGSYDCGSKVHPRFPRQFKVATFKPLLKDLLSASEAQIKEKKLSINYNIEIKSTPEDEKEGFQPDIQSFTDKVIAAISSVVSLDRVHIQSFDWRVLKYLHAKYPKIKTVALIEEKYTPQGVIKQLGFAPSVFSPDFNLLTKKDITFFHKKGVQIIPWTVNDVANMQKLKAMGVDGIITDYPDLIEQVK